MASILLNQSTRMEDTMNIQKREKIQQHDNVEPMGNSKQCHFSTEQPWGGMNKLDYMSPIYTVLERCG